MCGLSLLCYRANIKLNDDIVYDYPVGIITNSGVTDGGDADCVDYNAICSIFESIVKCEYELLSTEFGNRLKGFNIWLADKLDTYIDIYQYNI